MGAYSIRSGHSCNPDCDYAPPILRLADDPALCRRLAENAARDIPVYSWAEIAEQFESYFQSLF